MPGSLSHASIMRDMIESNAARSSCVGLRPECSIDRLASLAKAHDAEQVLTSAFASEWVAFEIQKQVAR